MKYFKFLSLVLLSTFTMVSCVDNEFDEPENTLEIPEDQVVTIESILNELDGGTFSVEDEIYLRGTVTASDESGNFYKLLTVQDETGAISISLDQNSLSGIYPQGSLVYIDLEGLTVAKDAGMPRIGLNIQNNRLERIPDALVRAHVLPAGDGEEIVPVEMTITEFESNPQAYLNKLVKLSNVEFAANEVGQTYAIAEDASGEPLTVNRTIVDCSGNEIILRNSGFASFVNEIIPKENGMLVAIASIFNQDLQLFIRDTEDVMFTGERCDGGGGVADNQITIEDIKARFYEQGADKVQEGFIQGVVTSDKNVGQLNNRNLFIQDETAGILLRFTGEHNFALGDELKITVSGVELSEYRGLLQINNLPLLNTERLGTAALPQPEELTVAEIIAENNLYEGRRVIIKGATLDKAGSKWQGNVGVMDGTGTITIFTYDSASYAQETVPSGTVDVTGVVSQFDETVQLYINGLQDIEGGSVNPGTGDFPQDFQDETTDDPVSIEGWLNIAVEGSRRWVIKEFDGEKYAECEAYQDNNPVTHAWLITPTINTEEANILNFDSQQAYWQHQGLSVWVSADFDNIEDAEWIELDANLADESDEFFTNVNSGNIDLTDYVSGAVRVGFKYEGTSASNTTKVRVDNVNVFSE